MADDDNGSGGEELGEIRGEPFDLGLVDAGFPVAWISIELWGGLDGVEDDEVIALVIEGVVGRADAFGVEGLTVTGGGAYDPGLVVDAELVVVADGVVDFEAEDLLSVVVEVKEAVGGLAVDTHGVEHVVSALDGEVGVEGGGFAEGHVAAFGRVQLGLDVGVGDEDEVEVGGRGCGWGVGVSRFWEQGGGSGHGAQGEKLATVDRSRSSFEIHAGMVARDGFGPIASLSRGGCCRLRKW